MTRAVVCDGSYCLGDAACATTYFVRAGSSGDGSQASPFGRLDDAAKRATAGDCIALAAGSYEGGVIPAGVSLLGAGADHVTISGGASGAALSESGGSGALLRGFTVQSAVAGIALDNTQDTRVEQVTIAAAKGVGIDARGASRLVLRNVSIANVELGAGASATHGIALLVGAGSTATIEACDIDGAKTQGLLVHGSSATISRVRVRHSGVYGVVIDCHEGCPAGGSRVERSHIVDNDAIGLLAIDGEVVLADNEIAGTRYGSGFARNVQLQGVKLDVRGNTVRDSLGQGIVVHQCSGTIDKNKVTANQDRGMVVQRVTAELLLSDNRIERNERSGLTLIESAAVKIKGGIIAETKKRLVLVGSKGVQVGDGVQLLRSSDTLIDGVTLRDNERVAVLADDSTFNALHNTFEGGEAQLVVQSGATGTYSGNKDDSGKPVASNTPVMPFENDPSELISTLPLPIP
ncbi:MAG: right-handed parallel beta-helix repeat-containing protein [Myxococcales bacterium]|nr:right-handed parallel beta-helix repeat-containing protein [Myxococcales bacterium]